MILRPQRLTQVGHEGNPVFCSIDVGEGDLLTPDEPTLVPPRLPSGNGSGGESVLNLNIGSSGSLNCFISSCVDIVITGGVGPYILETTNGVLTQITSTTYTLCANSNPGNAVPGTAYKWAAKYCSNSGFTDCVQYTFDCNGDIVAECSLADSICACPSGGCSGDISGGCVLFRKSGTTEEQCGTFPEMDICGGVLAHHIYCDARSQDMIDAGCSPCAVSFAAGAIVTVTDSLGHFASTVVESL